MIELAPNHKTGLSLTAPLIAGGGLFGFADEYADLIDFSKFGAFITNPITWRPRAPAEGQRVAQFPGGMLIHTGLPNPGLSAAIREYERKWAKLGCPVIVHLAATTPEDVAAGVEKLERVESVAGIEIGFRDDESLTEAELMLREAVQRSRQPVMVSVPFTRAGAFARLAEKVGAQALTVAAPPRGTLLVNGQPLTGRLYGPALLPQSLQLVHEIKKQTSLPIVAAGGVETNASVEAMLAAGAVAVVLENDRWAQAP